MRIAQMVIAKYEHIILEEVNSLDDTKRGKKGFGSTGQ
jgi:dUTP pyrophosphatase